MTAVHWPNGFLIIYAWGRSRINEQKMPRESLSCCWHSALTAAATEVNQPVFSSPWQVLHEHQWQHDYLRNAPGPCTSVPVPERKNATMASCYLQNILASHDADLNLCQNNKRLPNSSLKLFHYHSLMCLLCRVGIQTAPARDRERCCPADYICFLKSEELVPLTHTETFCSYQLLTTHPAVPAQHQIAYTIPEGTYSFW